ncbi:MAG TPA: NAD(P)H-binding protein, partial [Anaerolineales bacterium]|nr:NAD(P)H-binding protein [Anaerolineales bacterium]
MKLLVTGASGYIGSKLIPRLVAAGHQVVCLVRDPERLKSRNWNGVEIRQGDLLDPASLDQLMNGIDIAYYLVHSMADGVTGYIGRDYAAASNFSAAAGGSGLQRIIYLGGLGECEKGLSPHLEARQDVGNILRQSGVPVSEFRAAIIIGSGSMSFEMIRYLTERLPILPTPPWINTLCQPIAIGDILEYLVKSLAESTSSDFIYEIGGPDTLTYAEIMRGYAQARRLKRSMVTLPILTTSMLALG